MSQPIKHMTEVLVTLQPQTIDVTVNDTGETIIVDIGAPPEDPIEVTAGPISISEATTIPISPDAGNMTEQRVNGVYSQTRLATQDW